MEVLGLLGLWAGLYALIEIRGLRRRIAALERTHQPRWEKKKDFD
jgi:hypothetical protein